MCSLVSYYHNNLILILKSYFLNQILTCTWISTYLTKLCERKSVYSIQRLWKEVKTWRTLSFQTFFFQIMCQFKSLEVIMLRPTSLPKDKLLPLTREQTENGVIVEQSNIVLLSASHAVSLQGLCWLIRGKRYLPKAPILSNTSWINNLMVFINICTY